MGERAHRMGGELAVLPRAGGGTQVRLACHAPGRER
jgi:nitrate/nitrite-specific signal transduction histidine kinase